MTKQTSQIHVLMQQLLSLQLAAQSFAVQAELLYGHLSQLLETQTEPPPQTAGTDLTTEGCRHPPNLRDTSPRTMGHPTRFLCRLCGQVVDE